MLLAHPQILDYFSARLNRDIEESLVDLQETLGLSQDELAKLIKACPQLLSTKNCAEQAPRIRQFRALLGVTMDEVRTVSYTHLTLPTKA